MKLFRFSIVIIDRREKQRCVVSVWRGAIMMREHWKWTPLLTAAALGVTFALAFLQMV